MNTISKNLERAEKLLTDHPLTANLVKEDIRNMIKNYQQEIMELTQEPNIDDVEFPELKDEEIDAICLQSVASNPRALYDLFDKNNIFVNVHYLDNDHWTYYICTETESGEKSYSCTNRLDGEEKAFALAFDILENKLKIKEDGKSDDSRPKLSEKI